MSKKIDSTPQTPAKGGGFNPFSVVAGAVGAVAREVMDINRSVRNDLAAMTPPAAGQGAQPVFDTNIARTVAGSSLGLSEVSVPGEAAKPVPDDTPTAPVGPPRINPIDVLADPARRGQFTLDCYFHAYAPEDITGYPALISAESKPPYTFGLLAAEAGQAILQAALLSATGSHGRLFGILGMGPRDVWEHLDELDTTLTSLLNDNPRVLAVGPVGLDANYSSANMQQQQAQLQRQLEIAQDFGLPALVFQRKAVAELDAVLNGMEAKPVMVYVRPAESPEDAELITRHGMYALLRSELDNSGFNIHRALVASLPRERLLLASGSALVAPKALAGHFNSPAGLKHTLNEASALLGVPVPELRQTLNTNALRVFFSALLQA